MKSAMRLVFAAMMICCMLARPATATKPPKFTYNTIPYGAELDSVLAQTAGASVKEDSFLSFRGPGSYHAMISKYFSGGCSYFMGFEASLSSDVARKFVVTTGEGVSSDLYFTCDYGSNQPYRLFMVERTFDRPDGKYTNVFSGLRDAISEQTGLAASSHDAEYTEVSDPSTLTLDEFPARYAVWQTETRRVILLVGQDMYFSTQTNSPIVLYIWRPGLKRYLGACASQKKSQEEKESEKAKDLGRGF